MAETTTISSKKPHKSAQIASTDCLACILRPLLCMGVFIGISPILPTCTHNHTGQNQCKFKVAKWCYIPSIFYSTIMVAMFSFNIYEIVERKIHYTKAKNIQFATLLLLELCTIFVYLCVIFKVNQRVKELNGLVAIIANKDHYLIDVMFDRKTVLSLKKRSFLYILITIIIVSVHIVHISIFALKEGVVINYTVLVEILSCVSLIAEMALNFQLSLKIHVFAHLLTKCYDTIKAGLQENELSTHWAEPSGRVRGNRNKLSILIRRVHEMHVALMLNFNTMNSFMNPLMLFTIAITVLMLILSYYLLVFMWLLENNRNNTFYYMMEFKTGVIIGVMGYLLMISETLSNPVENILPFLEGYPITKLQPFERLQVEMFVTTLRVLRPQLSASKVFNISIGLVASILGTIVTYVLVALQFQASWTDED